MWLRGRTGGQCDASRLDAETERRGVAPASLKLCLRNNAGYIGDVIGMGVVGWVLWDGGMGGMI